MMYYVVAQTNSKKKKKGKSAVAYLLTTFLFLNAAPQCKRKFTVIISLKPLRLLNLKKIILT